MTFKEAYKLNKAFRSILEDYIIDKCLFYSKDGVRYVEKDTLNSLIGKLFKEVDNIIKYGHTSLPFN